MPSKSWTPKHAKERLEFDEDHPAARVYFARGVDGLVWKTVVRRAATVRAKLSHYNIVLVDPVVIARVSGVTKTEAIVEHDLSLLSQCNAVLMDMSIPNRNYIGYRIATTLDVAVSLSTHFIGRSLL